MPSSTTAQPLLPSHQHADDTNQGEIECTNTQTQPMSTPSAVFLLSATTFGAGVFMLPALFAKTGVFVGAALLIFFGLLSGLVMKLVLDAADEQQVEDMEALVRSVPGGRLLSRISATAIVIALVTGNAAHLYMCSGMLFDWLSWFITDTIGHFEFNAVHKLAVLCLFVGVALPYTFLEELSALRHIGSAVCIVCIISCTACVVSSVILIDQGHGADGQNAAPTSPDSFKDVALAVPTVCFIYTSLFPLFHVYGSMIRSFRGDKAAARRRMNRAIVWATVIQVTSFSIMAVVTTLTFGKNSGAARVSQSSDGNVLYNFPMDNLAVTGSSLMLIVVIVLDYPIMLFPCVAQALKLRLFGTWRFARHAYAVLFTLVILAIIMAVPDLPDVFGLAGSFGCSTYCLIVPGLVLVKSQRAVWGKFVGVATFVVGLGVLVVSGFFTLQSIVSKSG